MICGPLLVSGNHWCCIYANLTEESFVYIDPYGNIKEASNRDFEFWKSFAVSKGIIKSWKQETINFTVQKTKEINNCGVYVALYLKQLISSSKNLIITNSAADILYYRS